MQNVVVPPKKEKDAKSRSKELKRLLLRLTLALHAKGRDPKKSNEIISEIETLCPRDEDSEEARKVWRYINSEYDVLRGLESLPANAIGK